MAKLCHLKIIKNNLISHVSACFYFYYFFIFPFSFSFSFLSPLPRFLSRFLFWSQSAAHNNIPATTDPSSKSQQQTHNHNRNSILQPNPTHNPQFKKQINKTQISDLIGYCDPNASPCDDRSVGISPIFVGLWARGSRI